MSRLWLMCGIPGSGKSTWLKNNVDELLASVVSRDAIRFTMLDCCDKYFSKENQVYDVLVKTVDEGLKLFNDVYVDATHLSIGSRAKLLKRLNLSNVTEINAIVMNTPLNICLERNAKREGRARVPEDVIINMYKNFTFPTYDEGFTNIYIY